MRRPAGAIAIVGSVILAAAGCGKKGPPLPPLRPTPGAVTAVSARRVGSRIDLRFAIPTVNTDRTSPASIQRVEIYARSVPADSPRPVKEQIVLHENLVDTIDVKPPVPADESGASPAAAGAATPDARPADTRPGAGDVVTFSEAAPTAAPAPLPALKGKAAQAAAAAAAAARSGGAGAVPPAGGAAVPGAGAAVAPKSATSASGGATPPAGTTAAGATTAAGQAGGAAATATPRAGAAAAAKAVAAPPPPAPPTRYFWIQAISPHGQIGPPPDLVAVPLIDPPAAPTAPTIHYDEKTLTFTWEPGAEGETFRVYQLDADGKEKSGQPLNDAPLKTPSYEAPVVFDQPMCLAVRAVDVRGVAAVESDAAHVCETPHDTFPPAAPTNLDGLPDNGAIALRWDPVSAADLAGYLVLRGEGTGDTLQQLTPAPLIATTYVDATVRRGATYVYVVVAVDKATPPNASAHSNTYTVTIR